MGILMPRVRFDSGWTEQGRISLVVYKWRTGTRGYVIDSADSGMYLTALGAADGAKEPFKNHSPRPLARLYNERAVGRMEKLLRGLHERDPGRIFRLDGEFWALVSAHFGEREVVPQFIERMVKKYDTGIDRKAVGRR